MRQETSVCILGSAKNDEDNVTSTTANVTSQQAASVVLLQNLTASVGGAKTSGRYRVLFDGGSQQRFTSAYAAQRVGCEPFEERR